MRHLILFIALIFLGKYVFAQDVETRQVTKAELEAVEVSSCTDGFYKELALDTMGEGGLLLIGGTLGSLSFPPALPFFVSSSISMGAERKSRINAYETIIEAYAGGGPRLTKLVTKMNRKDGSSIKVEKLMDFLKQENENGGVCDGRNWGSLYNMRYLRGHIRKSVTDLE
jgi:hypothetical protein